MATTIDLTKIPTATATPTFTTTKRLNNQRHRQILLTQSLLSHRPLHQLEQVHQQRLVQVHPLVKS